jgi:alkaline phosphatase D
MAFFQHGVASGDPLQDRVILWTRVTSDTPQEIELKWEIAEDPDFQHMVSSGVILARIEDDQTGQRKFFSVKVASDFSEGGSLCGFGFLC